MFKPVLPFRKMHICTHLKVSLELGLPGSSLSGHSTDRLGARRPECRARKGATRTSYMLPKTNFLDENCPAVPSTSKSLRLIKIRYTHASGRLSPCLHDLQTYLVQESQHQGSCKDPQRLIWETLSTANMTSETAHFRWESPSKMSPECYSKPRKSLFYDFGLTFCTMLYPGWMEKPAADLIECCS